MSLNKIIFFLLLVMPEGQIKGAEHLPDNVQCTQIMTPGSPSPCQSWVLGHWEICSNSCLTVRVSVCSGLSHVSAFQTAISALHTFWFQGSPVSSRSLWQESPSVKAWSDWVKKQYSLEQALSIRAGKTLHNIHLTKVFNHLFCTICLISVLLKLVFKSS